MSQYIIRNGGFQLQEARKRKPESIAEGTKLVCKIATDTTTKGRKYAVLGHFCYLNTYGPKGQKVAMWDEFVTVKNDYGFTIKVNLFNFK